MDTPRTLDLVDLVESLRAPTKESPWYFKEWDDKRYCAHCHCATCYGETPDQHYAGCKAGGAK